MAAWLMFTHIFYTATWWMVDVQYKGQDLTLKLEFTSRVSSVVKV